jgi:tripartite-type tricarboxylate transporter receptor subunit TctC
MKTLGAILMLALSVLCAPAGAQEYPDKTVRVILPFAAGGPTDVVGRVVADRLSSLLGQRFVVENRPGGGGNIAVSAMKQAAPDGYTLMFATVSAMAVNPALQRNAPYDPVKDFEAVGQIGTTPIVLVVPPSVPATDLKTLTAYLKKPGVQASYGSAGSGSVTHLAGELMLARLDVKDAPHVSYRGSGPMLVDLIGDRLTFAFDTLPTALAHIRSGALRPIGMATSERAPGLPDVPTLDEQGLKGFDVASWYAFFAPAGTPRAIVDRLNQAINQILREPDLAARLRELGVDPTPGLSPAQVAAMVKAEVARWAEAVRLSGATIN